MWYMYRNSYKPATGILHLSFCRLPERKQPLAMSIAANDAQNQQREDNEDENADTSYQSGFVWQQQAHKQRITPNNSNYNSILSVFFLLSFFLPLSLSLSFSLSSSLTTSSHKSLSTWLNLLHIRFWSWQKKRLMDSICLPVLHSQAFIILLMLPVSTTTMSWLHILSTSRHKTPNTNNNILISVFDRSSSTFLWSEMPLLCTI